MADETAYLAPSSLVDHCHRMGLEHNPNNFGTSVPGGIWGQSPTAHKPKGRNSNNSLGDGDCGGVPIYRVNHEMNPDGVIFTPIDDSSLLHRRSSPAAAVPVVKEDEEHMASQSLSDFCKALGEKHDPTQFGTSVPGGCWGTSADVGLKLSGGNTDKDGIPIHRVNHKMNADGMIFTPSQSTLATAMVVGSVESDYACSPANVSSFGQSIGKSPQLNLFDRGTRDTSLQLPAGSPPAYVPGRTYPTQPNLPPTAEQTLSDVLGDHVTQTTPPYRSFCSEEGQAKSSPIPTPPHSPQVGAAASPSFMPSVPEATLDTSPGTQTISSTTSACSVEQDGGHPNRQSIKTKDWGKETSCKASPKCSIM